MGFRELTGPAVQLDPEHCRVEGRYALRHK
jgi:hypothetical protein